MQIIVFIRLTLLFCSHSYGIVCLLIPFALAMSWIIYTKPAMFALGLLALNAANVIMWVRDRSLIGVLQADDRSLAALRW